MPILIEAWKEDPQEPGSQDPSPGSDPQTAPEGINEDPVPAQRTDGSPEAPRPSTGVRNHGFGDHCHIFKN